MSDKTKYKWLPWALALSVVIAGIVLTSNYGNWYFLAPWNPAKTLVATKSINEFAAGVPDTAPYWNLRLTALAVLLVTFIIGPSLWVYAEIKNQARSSADALSKGVVWYVGVILVISSLQVVPVTIIKGIVFHNTWEIAAQNKNKEELRSDLMKMGFEAVQYYYLPQRLGGTSGSFRAVSGQDGNWRPLELADLSSYPSDTKNTYRIGKSASDSILTIHGIGYNRGPNPDFRNADGRRGKLQLTIEVDPRSNFDFKRMNAK